MFRIDLGVAVLRSPKTFLAGAILLAAAAGCSTNKVTGPAKPVPLTIQGMGVGGAGRTGTPSAGLASGATAVDDPLPVTFTKALLVVRDVRFKLTEDAGTDSTDA